MWMTGICRHCGTVIAVQSTQSQIRILEAGRLDGYYCPLCFGGRIERLKPCRAEKLDVQYDILRTQYILKNTGTGGNNEPNAKTSQIEAYFQEGRGRKTEYNPGLIPANDGEEGDESSA